MLDRDLAELYGVKAIRLREQVKRNVERFPENFMFQLTEEETEIMVSQNAIPSKKHLGYEKEKELTCAALKCKDIKGDQLSAASFFLSGKPIATASFTS